MKACPEVQPKEPLPSGVAATDRREAISASSVIPSGVCAAKNLIPLRIAQGLLAFRVAQRYPIWIVAALNAGEGLGEFFRRPVTRALRRPASP